MWTRAITNSLYPNDPAVSVLMYIIEHTDPESKIFSRSYSQIVKDLKVSRATVASVLARLNTAGVIVNIGRGEWLNKMIGSVEDDFDGADLLAEYKGK